MSTSFVAGPEARANMGDGDGYESCEEWMGDNHRDMMNGDDESTTTEEAVLEEQSLDELFIQAEENMSRTTEEMYEKARVMEEEFVEGVMGKIRKYLTEIVEE